MTPNQLPPLPDGVTLEDLLIPLRAALDTCHDTDWSLRQFKAHISHTLAALAQQAKEPVAGYAMDEQFAHAIGEGAHVGASVVIYKERQPRFANTPIYTTPQPTQQAQEPVAASAKDVASRALGEAAPLLYRAGHYEESGRCNAALLILEGLAVTTPQPQPAPPVPAPVDERHRAVALELDRLMLVIESAVRWQDPTHHPAVLSLLKANRAALQSPAPQTKGGEA